MKRLNTISAKLMLSFTIMLALVGGLSYSSIRAIGRLGTSLDEAANTNARKLGLVGEIQRAYEELRAESTKVEMSFVNMSIERLNTGAQGSTCAGCHTLENVRGQKSRFDGAAGRLRQTLAELRPLISDGEERGALDRIDSGVTEWLALYEKYMSTSRQGDFSGSHEIMLDRIYPLIESLQGSAGALAKHQQLLLANASRAADAQVERSRATAGIFLGLCLAAGCGVFWIVRTVSATLRVFAAEMGEVTVQV